MLSILLVFVLVNIWHSTKHQQVMNNNWSTLIGKKYYSRSICYMLLWKIYSLVYDNNYTLLNSYRYEYWLEWSANAIQNNSLNTRIIKKIFSMGQVIYLECNYVNKKRYWSWKLFRWLGSRNGWWPMNLGFLIIN